MREPGVAETLLRERLPRHLARRLAGPPELLPETWIDEGLRASFADLVMRAPLRGGKTAWVYCLVEHKRSQEELALLQLLRYLTAMYLELGRELSPPLPLVVPLIVYNGTASWSGPRRFASLIDTTRTSRHLAIDFGIELVDVGTEPIELLSANPTLRGGLLGLKAAATPRAKLGRVLRELVAALAHDPSTLRLFLRYLLRVVGHEALPLIERAAAEQAQESTGMQTIEEFLVSRGFRRGKRQGLKEGLERGREEGREAALRDAVRRVISRRFKQVTAATEGKLAGADAERLNAWLDRALTARSQRSIFETH